MTIPVRIGRYHVVGPLATGGMAEVLLGKLFGPKGFESAVVIKRVLPHLARQREFVTMFTDEARIVSHIRHPNVVSVSDFGTEDDNLFLVMEYLEGEVLEGVIRRTRSLGRGIDFALVAHIGAEVCAGLHAAHEFRDPDGKLQGLVHRDVSPQNIFVTYDGQVKLIDFGIAKAAGRDTLTEAGSIKGKFAYMSPEQCQADVLDRRSDIFSLGIVLYELSTGRRLFARANAAMAVEAICNRTFPRPGELVDAYPPALERCILRALARPPHERFQTAAEMRRALLEVHRALGADVVPEERLAKEMKELFSERIEEKRTLLRNVQAGEAVTNIPAAVVDSHVELPTVALGSANREPTRKRQRWMFAAGAAAGAIALTAVGLVLFGAREPAPFAKQPVPAVTATNPVVSPAVPAPPPAGPSPQPAAVRVDPEPTGAAASAGKARRDTGRPNRKSPRRKLETRSVTPPTPAPEKKPGIYRFQ